MNADIPVWTQWLVAALIANSVSLPGSLWLVIRSDLLLQRTPATGRATTIAVLLHEIPHELGDFGILVHSGVGPRRALALNFFSGLIALVGAVATLLLPPLESIGVMAILLVLE